MTEFPYYSRQRIKESLAESGAAVRKRWGQNFVVDPNQARRIAGEILARTVGPLFEIGPGFGAVTHLLLDAGRSLLAAEIDPVLSALIAREYKDRLEVYAGDARDILAREAPLRDFCGNLPYYISTELLLGAVQGGASRAVFLLQKEFALRAAAKDSVGSLPVFLSCFGESRVVLHVPASSFFPKPEVESSLLSFSRHPDGPRCPPHILEEILRASFGMRRKMLRGAWKHAPRSAPLFAAAEEVGINLERRAEELSKEEFFSLARAFEGEKK